MASCGCGGLLGLLVGYPVAAYGGTVDVAVGVVGGVGALVVVVVGCAVAADPPGVLIGLLALICFLLGLIPLLVLKKLVWLVVVSLLLVLLVLFGLYSNAICHLVLSYALLLYFILFF